MLEGDHDTLIEAVESAKKITGTEQKWWKFWQKPPEQTE